SRRRHTRFSRDWSSDVCSSDLCCKTDFVIIKAKAASQLCNSDAGNDVSLCSALIDILDQNKPYRTAIKISALAIGICLSSQMDSDYTFQYSTASIPRSFDIPSLATKKPGAFAPS